jgi:hypothetical protein
MFVLLPTFKEKDVCQTVELCDDFWVQNQPPKPITIKIKALERRIISKNQDLFQLRCFTHTFNDDMSYDEVDGACGGETLARQIKAKKSISGRSEVYKFEPKQIRHIPAQYLTQDEWFGLFMDDQDATTDHKTHSEVLSSGRRTIGVGTDDRQADRDIRGGGASSCGPSTDDYAFGFYKERTEEASTYGENARTGTEIDAVKIFSGHMPNLEDYVD